MDQTVQLLKGDGLQPLGLSEDERVVYEALVDLGSATAAELRGIAPVSSGRLARVLQGLDEKGLVGRGAGRPARYSVVPPEVGLDQLLAVREEELRRARRAALDLTERFHRARARRDVSGLVEIVSGQRTVRERYSAVHRSAREQLRVTTRPPFYMRHGDTRVITAEAHEMNVRVRNIIDPRYLELDPHGGRIADIRADLAGGEEYRVMPSVPLKLLIADDRAALIPLEIHAEGVQSAVLFHASALLDALIEMFETCWALAHSLNLSDVGDDNVDLTGDPITADERDLLALLSAGIPDGAIARQLGVSHTTVQRRVLALKTRLGADTRFQAGVQAVRRGWITEPDQEPDGT